MLAAQGKQVVVFAAKLPAAHGVQAISFPGSGLTLPAVHGEHELPVHMKPAAQEQLLIDVAPGRLELASGHGVHAAAAYAVLYVSGGHDTQPPSVSCVPGGHAWHTPPSSSNPSTQTHADSSLAPAASVILWSAHAVQAVEPEPDA